MAYGSPTHQHDSLANAAWQAELEARREVTPEELVHLVTPEQIDEYDTHQREVVAEGVGALIKSRFPAPKDDEERTAQRILENNMADYDDLGGGQLSSFTDGDDVMQALLEVHNFYRSNEDFTKAIRARRSILAHFVLTELSEGKAEAGKEQVADDEEGSAD
ncbi:MAG TPA: hypothetical protein VLF87_02505 [Patescibacteria group bacterium]|nr:hypothetical protein [Patescibacteria group bacterium]